MREQIPRIFPSSAAHHAPEFRKEWPRFGELVNEADPCLYDVVHVEAA